MRFLFVDSRQELEGMVRFEPGQLHYLVNVLRMEAGQDLAVVPREGDAVWATRLERLGRRGLQARIVGREALLASPGPPMRLYLSSLKSDRLEWALQKAVELGADGFFVVRSRHSVKLPWPAVLPRLRAIAEAACQQCGRPRPPELGLEPGLEAALVSAGRGEALVTALHPSPHGGLLPPHPPPPGDSRGGGNPGWLRELELDRGRPVACFIGPEGGFAPEELESFARHRVRLVSFAGNILRAETAAVAALTLLLTRLGRL